MVNFIFFLFVIGITMFSNHPLFLGITCVGAWTNCIFMKGKQAAKSCCLLFVPVCTIVPFINVLNVHKGVTVLFYLNDNPITLEACIYGLVQAVLLGSVILWFSCVNESITSDKWIYLLGRRCPTLGLLVSMVLRFIPLLKHRLGEIRQGQHCMGRKQGVRQFFKELSILTAWSLEASIDTADSMEARGYGLKGRSSYHLFRFRKQDAYILTVILLLGSFVALAVWSGRGDIYYYPEIRFLKQDVFSVISLVSFAILNFLPLILEGIERERKHEFVRVEEV